MQRLIEVWTTPQPEDKDQQVSSYGCRAHPSECGVHSSSDLFAGHRVNDKTVIKSEWKGMLGRGRGKDYYAFYLLYQMETFFYYVIAVVVVKF